MVNPKILISRQGRDEISGSQVKRLARNMREEGYDVSKPVEIANVEGKRIIIDGHHRVEAAKRAGISEIPARTLPTTSNQDSQLLREAAEASKFRTER